MIQKLFNPFVQIAGTKSLIYGLSITLITCLLCSFFNTRFDGVLDAHFTLKQSYYLPFIDLLVNMGCITFVFYVLGVSLTHGKTRFIDILGTTTLARFPYLIVPLLNIQNLNSSIGTKLLNSLLQQSKIVLTSAEWIFLISSGIIALLITIWYIYLLFKAYAISTNLKKTTLIISFIGGIILAEILSKIVLSNL
jgi:hypothetical protein